MLSIKSLQGCKEHQKNGSQVVGKGVPQTMYNFHWSHHFYSSSYYAYYGDHLEDLKIKNLPLTALVLEAELDLIMNPRHIPSVRC